MPVYGCMCAWVWVCELAHTGTHMHTLRNAGTLVRIFEVQRSTHPSSGAIHFVFFEMRISPWYPRLPSQVKLTDQQAIDTFLPGLPSTGIPTVFHHTQTFNVETGDQTQILLLSRQALY